MSKVDAKIEHGTLAVILTQLCNVNLPNLVVAPIPSKHSPLPAAQPSSLKNQPSLFSSRGPIPFPFHCSVIFVILRYHKK